MRGLYAASGIATTMSNAALLQTFFTDRLIAQRRASQYGFLNAPAFLAELFSLPCPGRES